MIYSEKVPIEWLIKLLQCISNNMLWHRGVQFGNSWPYVYQAFQNGLRSYIGTIRLLFIVMISFNFYRFCTYYICLSFYPPTTIIIVFRWTANRTVNWWWTMTIWRVKTKLASRTRWVACRFIVWWVVPCWESV